MEGIDPALNWHLLKQVEGLDPALTLHWLCRLALRAYKELMEGLDPAPNWHCAKGAK